MKPLSEEDMNEIDRELEINNTKPMDSFLPDNYKEPVTTNYMKFKNGNNTFRVLGSAVIGWEYWIKQVVEGKEKPKSIRVQNEEMIPKSEVVADKFEKPNFYFFWAFPVYNFGDERIQILRIRQKSIREDMQNNIKNPKWGNPRDYNFVISMDKERKPMYSVSVEPKEVLPKAIIDKYHSMNIDMSIWMQGGDPFIKNE